MQATKNCAVKITYQLRTEPIGPVVDEAHAHQPFSFLFGHQNVLPKFESALDNLKSGDTFSFTLAPEEGYGIHNPESIIEMDVNNFANTDGTISHEILALGSIIPLQDSEGNRYQGVIVSNVDGMVTIDLNHPMAGKTLYFSGTVIEVRNATAEELEHGHVHDGTHNH